MTTYMGFGTLSYATAKAGIVGFTCMLSGELQKHGITVNAILPSAITGGFPDIRPRFGGGETKGPEYIAPIVVYLATNEAANITGSFIYSSSGDVVIFDTPLQLNGPAKFLRKKNNWTVDELHEIIPMLI